MHKEEIKYYHWLEKISELYPYHREYSVLFEILYSIPFYAVLPMDENEFNHVLEMRADNGFSRNIRKRISKNSRGDNWPEVSILEVIISLAIRCEDLIMQDPYEGDRTSNWIWMIIFNLGLDTFTDDILEEEYPGHLETLEDIIFDFLDRRYASNGVGSPFYIPNSKMDMKETSIWMQLQFYMADRYSDEAW